MDWDDANIVKKKKKKERKKERKKKEWLLMKSAREDNIQLARLTGWMELRSVRKCLLRHLMVRRFFRAGGREFQIDDPETGFIQVNAGSWWNKVVRTIPTRGSGEERANVLGSLPTAYFKHHHSFTVF